MPEQKRFEFQIVETTHGTIEIGAESYEDALLEVEEAYSLDHVVWGDASLTVKLNKEWEDA